MSTIIKKEENENSAKIERFNRTYKIPTVQVRTVTITF